MLKHFSVIIQVNFIFKIFNKYGKSEANLLDLDQ